MYPYDGLHFSAKLGGGVNHAGFYKMAIGLLFVLAFLVTIWFSGKVGLTCLAISMAFFAWGKIERRAAMKRRERPVSSTLRTQ